MAISLFFLLSSTFFHKLAILLVTSFFPVFLPPAAEVTADSETVSEMLLVLNSALDGVRLPKLVLLGDCFMPGLGILVLVAPPPWLRVLEVVLEPEPCRDRDLSLRAEVRVWGMTTLDLPLGVPAWLLWLEPGLFGGFFSSTSMSTIILFKLEDSSLVKVPCRTSRLELLELLVLEMVELAGEAKGARILETFL